MADIQKSEPYPDGGSLFSSQSKKGPKSPDYFGEIAIRVSDLTAVDMVDGLYCIKLNGWKRTSKNGKTFLSLAVNRYVPDDKKPRANRDQAVDF